ncbi:alcohol dehydrogenase catalytic domain-containing protein [Thermosphaera chiliense]|uniref:Alcohol dehydrogenase catalytic domain-containing protein n=1 Tax=Thermosphaera chiliense TaxID=3402707 RepID=A0A7M1UQ64_9CREN|nr:alcohol dehydrogenase catalytic domain-containing protein [Thermosphaera aggregans]QOR94226.1 alcohol dehydrogenase catalytic domain-containing protein [Thermosphaera aggregans]
MKALVLHAPKDLRLEEVEDPRPGSGEVLIRVKRVGICGTDKAFYKGSYRPGKLPIIPGHELVGKIVDVGKGVEPSLIGVNVTSEINFYCGKCSFCRAGLKTHCPYRETLGITRDGGMAEYVISRSDLVHNVEGLSEVQSAFVEPLASIVEMLELAPVASFHSVAVIGVGTIGLLALRTISSITRPRRLIAVVRKDSPKQVFVENSNVDEIVDEAEIAEYVKKHTDEGQGFDYVVEATGSPDGMKLAVEIVKPRGVISVKSTHGVPIYFDVTKFVVKEARLVGSRCGPFEKAIELLRNGLVKVDDLVTSEYPLSEGVEAFARSFQRDQVKVHILV